MTFQKVWISLAPSTRAASDSSLRDAEHELAHQEDVERVPEEGRHDQGQEGVDPRLGSLQPERRQLAEDVEQGDQDHRVGQEQRRDAEVEERVRPGHWILEKPYATTVFESTAPIVIPTVMIIELIAYSPNGM